MKKIVLRYGLLSVALLVVTGVLNYFLNRGSFSNQELGGYIGIIISMIFVFIGIRQYRDKVNGGTITYGKAFVTGFLIVLFPSVAFGLFDVIYVKFLDPGFMERYYSNYVQQMKASLPPAQFEAKLQSIEKEKAMFTNIWFQFLLMASTVLIIGIIATAISSLILQKKPKTITA